MLPDIHLHTEFSTDSDAKPEEMIEAAIRCGMKTICFTDHHDYDMPGEGFRIDPEAYWIAMKRVQEQYRDRIRVLIGVEIGMQPYLHDEILRFVNTVPFDFVIGSRHAVGKSDPYYREEYSGTDEEMFFQYFEEELACVQNIDGIQTLGHLDYVVRYGYKKAAAYSYRKYADIIDEILRTLIRRGIALELNTGGYRSGIGFPNPHPDVLMRYRELGGELITLGSDAHFPEHIGYAYQEAIELLKAAGFTHVTIFDQKIAEFIAI